MPSVIENPVINSPFVEPTKHFRFADDGITNEIVAARRISSYFIRSSASLTSRSSKRTVR